MSRRYECTELRKHWYGVIYEARGTDRFSTGLEVQNAERQMEIIHRMLMEITKSGGVEMRSCLGGPELNEVKSWI